MKRVLLGLVLGFLLFLLPFPVFAGRGCCSWHGGQAYCDTSVGRWVCNDGTYSPSCGCYKAPVVVTIPKPTPKPTIASTPMPTPTETPKVKAVSIEATPTPSPLSQATARSVVEGLVTGGVMVGLGYLGLKWLAKKTAPEEGKTQNG